MGTRFLLALGAFLLVCGAGGLWLGLKVLQKKRIVKSLLSLPKERRFFWYKLRQAGYEIYSHTVSHEERFFIDENEKHSILRADFLAKKDGRKYVCLSMNSLDDKELLKLFFTYRFFFKTDGVVFYDQNARSVVKWD